MAFSPQDEARTMIQSLRLAHAEATIIAAMSNSELVITVKNKVEAVCNQMAKAAASLSTLQSAFTNQVIATRIAEHLEPSPADLVASYSAARTAFTTMADDYGTNVLPDMGSPWSWDAVTRSHDPATYNIDSTANFRGNVTALRDALAVFV